MTLFVNGRVIARPGAALDAGRTHPARRAEVPYATPACDRAVAVHAGRIVEVGEAGRLRHALRDAYGTEAGEVVDLEGGVVLPGFVDSHIHSALFARSLFSADLRGARSVEEALQRVRDHVLRAGAAQTGQWVFGTAWDHNQWDVPVVPDRHGLDRVTGNTPAALHSGDAHTWWVNTAGLRALGIDRSTADPPGGTIERAHGGAEDDEPTGILREAAGQHVDRLLATGAGGDLSEQLGHAQRVLWGLGITGVHDFDGEDCRDAYLDLHARGILGLRVTKSIPLIALDHAIDEGRRTGAGDEWMRTGAVKIFTDGALGSHTCLMHSPMRSPALDEAPGSELSRGVEQSRGVETISEAELYAVIDRATAAGISIAAHAIGDRANARILDVLAGGPLARQDPTGSQLRHRIEHAQHMTPDDVRRLARLGVVASMQPVHATADFELVEELLEGHRLRSYAWRSLLDAGAQLTFGSDAPVETPSPLAAVHAAVTRQRRDGRPEGGWQPEERISVAEALAGYTSGPAYAAGQEHLSGTIEPGGIADFTVLGADPFAVPAHELAEIPVAGVITGGTLRHWA